MLSEPLAEGITRRLEAGEQTILLLNRRGYASFVQCRDCGHVWQCGRCNVSLTYHRTRRRLICHYCFHEEGPPARCTECGSEMLSFRGLGTEQVERIVAETFPTARIARMDVDTTSGKWAHHEILCRVERREVDILLGTQMIAKGLDFPNVTLVGVINADVGMNLPDFRAGERTFQLLTSREGDEAACTGATQIRAGVMRPEILVPLSPDEQAREAVDAEFADQSVDRQVRTHFDHPRAGAPPLLDRDPRLPHALPPLVLSRRTR